MFISPRVFKWLFPCLALLLGMALYCGKPALLERFALPLEDFKFSVREQLGQAPVGDPRLVIVAVDETSINRYGRWPWSHGVMAQLVRRLDQARLVGFDMVFADPTLPAEDEALANAMSDGDNVVAGFFLRSQATRWTSLADLDQLAEWAFRDVRVQGAEVGLKDYPFVETNLPAIGESALAGGFFNGEPDLGGLYRRYPLACIHKGFVLPSLAVQMTRYALDREPHLTLGRQGVDEFVLGDLRLHEATLRLNFGQIDPQVFVPAADVLDGRLPESFFKDKLVVVGVTEVGVFDLRPTPINPVTPGVWIHYTALSNLLTGRLLKTVPALDLVLLAATLGIAWLIARQRRLGLRVVLYAAVPLAVLATANLLLLYGDIWTREFYALLPYLVLVVAQEAFAFFHTELRAGELKRAFTSYVSPEVVREILDHPEKLDLGGVERDISILFSDIRGFTGLSEQVSAPQLVQMLNMIHDPLTQVVLRQRGMLDKYIGDAMMALFNTPVALDDHPDRAVQAALDMVAALGEINRQFEAQGLPRVDMGVGINSGLCVVGNMGSKVRFEYTAIGDAVNLASRLEGLCKVYRTRIVISEFTRARLRQPFLLRQLDLVRVKGKSQPVAIYEVMEDNDHNRRIRERFDAALTLYFARDFAAARPLFAALAETDGDRCSQVFMARCDSCIEQLPAREWDGVFEFQTK